MDVLERGRVGSRRAEAAGARASARIRSGHVEALAVPIAKSKGMMAVSSPSAATPAAPAATAVTAAGDGANGDSHDEPLLESPKKGVVQFQVDKAAAATTLAINDDAAVAEKAAKPEGYPVSGSKHAKVGSERKSEKKCERM